MAAAAAAAAAAVAAAAAAEGAAAGAAAQQRIAACRSADASSLSFRSTLTVFLLGRAIFNAKISSPAAPAEEPPAAAPAGEATS